MYIVYAFIYELRPQNDKVTQIKFHFRLRFGLAWFGLRVRFIPSPCVSVCQRSNHVYAQRVKGARIQMEPNQSKPSRIVDRCDQPTENNKNERIFSLYHSYCDYNAKRCYFAYICNKFHRTGTGFSELFPKLIHIRRLVGSEIRKLLSESGFSRCYSIHRDIRQKQLKERERNERKKKSEKPHSRSQISTK